MGDFSNVWDSFEMGTEVDNPLRTMTLQTEHYLQIF